MRVLWLIALLDMFWEGSSTECSGSIFEQQYPQFQIISAAKTGSTSLYSYLCQHSSIKCLARKKETNLLRNDQAKPKNEQVITYFWRRRSTQFFCETLLRNEKDI